VISPHTRHELSRPVGRSERRWPKINNTGLDGDISRSQAQYSAVAERVSTLAYAKVEAAATRIRGTAPIPREGDCRPIQAGLIGSALTHDRNFSTRCRQTGETRVPPCFDARHHLPACPPVFLFRGPLGRAHSPRCRHHHRAVDRGDQRGAQSMEQPLLQRAARAQLGQFRLGAVVLLCPGGDLHRDRGLSTLSQSMAADPVAALDDAAISRSLARRC
jgi:hypothetical protein